MEIKTVKATYQVSEYEEEETWLATMYVQGWKLVDIKGNKYVFEKCESEEWIYQLDFQSKNTSKDDYIRLFEDYGWSFVAQHNNWFYFRRKKEAVETDFSIFSDKDSKIAMCERVLHGRLTVNVAIFFIAGVIVALTIFTNFFTNPDTVLIPRFPQINDFVKAALPWVGAGLLIATSYSFSSYNKIRNKISLMKNPLT